MFHHFHSSDHIKSQGSISSEDFDALLSCVEKDFNLLTASKWLEKALAGNLTAKDTCITFDDTLQCQLDVALPVMESRNIEAFWFLCSSFLERGDAYLEIFRQFRTINYESVDDFYKDFESVAFDLMPQAEDGIKEFNPKEYLSQFPFYSDEDRKFRFLRDKVLSSDSYHKIMMKMISNKSFNIQKCKENLWISVKDARDLIGKNHVIGLHSANHPTQLCSLPIEEQFEEYKTNFEFIEKELNYQPVTMSHPCNSYDERTLDVLKELGIKVGFRSNIDFKNTHGPLEFTREDHSNLMRRYDLL